MFLVSLIVFCPTCRQCPHCCSKSASRGKTESVLENLDCLRGQLQGHKNPKGALHLLLLEPTSFSQVSSHHKWLCQFYQEQLTDGAVICTYSKDCGTKGKKSNISVFLQQNFSWFRKLTTNGGLS